MNRILAGTHRVRRAFGGPAIVLASAILLTLACRREQSVAISRTPEPTVTSDGAPEPSVVAEPEASPPSQSLEPTEVEAVKKLGEQAVLALETRDMKRFATFVDPKAGVRFTPYSFIDASSDVLLTRAQLEGALADGTVRLWGAFDGSGDPIRLSFAGYFKRFVYDADYARAPQVSIDHSLGSGNSVDNVSKLHPNAHVVEWHFPGIDPKFDGMDWRSLRLVFEKDAGGRWWIVSVIHDEWTI